MFADFVLRRLYQAGLAALLAVAAGSFLFVSPASTAAQEEAAPAAGSTETAEKKPARPPIYDESAVAADQVAAALARAKKENRRVLIQWGANWCGWCHLLHDCFRTSPEVRQKLLYEYDLVLVDVGHGDKNLELAEKYGADFAKQGLPFLTVLDGDGNVVANQETECLESKDEGVKGHNPDAVLEFLTKHQGHAPAAETVLAAGIDRARQDGKLVFLHFGAPWCGWCHRLEDWMALSENAEVLDRYFVDIKIDTDRMEGGAELLEKYRKGGAGGIPWFLFLDPQSGETVAVSEDAKGNNLGFPWTDEEIAGFGAMLEKAGGRIASGDREHLLQSLKANREQIEARRIR